jgi:hypothetical protein
MNQSIEFTIVVETHTFSEGGDWDRFRESLRSACSIAAEGNGEVVVTDVSGLPELEIFLQREFPQLRRINAAGAGYDEAKMLAAHSAQGKFVLYLDGDCIPQPRWHQHMLSALRSSKTGACGGYTRYDGGFFAAICSVMDFGFFYPVIPKDLKCYASNNCGFTKEALEKVPMGESKLRCGCYYHAQHLMRKSVAIQLVPEAKVLHEMQPIIRERTRQGYDTVAACWQDPELPEARWLRAGIFSLPLFYTMQVALDWKRVWVGRNDLNLAFWQVALSFPLFALLRILDAIGMLRAFIVGREETAWGGFLLKRRSL